MERTSDSCTPIACSLTDVQVRERRAELQTELRNATVEGTRELPDGYVMCFSPQPGLIDRLARFIEFESVCCPFMTFTLEVQQNHGPVSLTLTGPPGTGEFLRGEVQVEVAIGAAASLDAGSAAPDRCKQRP